MDPPSYDPSPDAMLHAARHERLMPGFGDIDLVGLCAAMPENFVFSVEAPNDRRLSEVGLDAFVREAYVSTVSVLEAAGGEARAYPRFTESRTSSILLFLRASGRKTGSTFPGSA